MKPKFDYITQAEQNRFLGNKKTDYIVTGILAVLFCATIGVWVI